MKKKVLATDAGADADADVSDFSSESEYLDFFRRRKKTFFGNICLFVHPSPNIVLKVRIRRFFGPIMFDAFDVF